MSEPYDRDQNISKGFSEYRFKGTFLLWITILSILKIGDLSMDTLKDWLIDGVDDPMAIDANMENFAPILHHYAILLKKEIIAEDRNYSMFLYLKNENRKYTMSFDDESNFVTVDSEDLEEPLILPLDDMERVVSFFAGESIEEIFIVRRLVDPSIDDIVPRSSGVVDIFESIYPVDIHRVAYYQYSHDRVRPVGQEIKRWRSSLLRLFNLPENVRDRFLKSLEN